MKARSLYLRPSRLGGATERQQNSLHSLLHPVTCRGFAQSTFLNGLALARLPRTSWISFSRCFFEKTSKPRSFSVMPQALLLPSQAQKLELQKFTLATSVAFCFFKSAHLDFSTLYLSSTGLVSVQDKNFLEKTMCAQKGQHVKYT